MFASRWKQRGIWPAWQPCGKSSGRAWRRRSLAMRSATPARWKRPTARSGEAGAPSARALLLQDEHLTGPGGGLRPDERRARIGTLERATAGADLADQQTAGVQPGFGFADYFVYEKQAILAAREGHAGLVSILGRQLFHGRRVHIRWVGNNEVVAIVFE